MCNVITVTVGKLVCTSILICVYIIYFCIHVNVTYYIFFVLLKLSCVYECELNKKSKKKSNGESRVDSSERHEDDVCVDRGALWWKKESGKAGMK